MRTMKVMIQKVDDRRRECRCRISVVGNWDEIGKNFLAPCYIHVR